METELTSVSQLLQLRLLGKNHAGYQARNFLHKFLHNEAKMIKLLVAKILSDQRSVSGDKRYQP